MDPVDRIHRLKKRQRDPSKNERKMAKKNNIFLYIFHIYLKNCSLSSLSQQLCDYILPHTYIFLNGKTLPFHLLSIHQKKHGICQIPRERRRGRRRELENGCRNPSGHSIRSYDCEMSNRDCRGWTG